MAKTNAHRITEGAYPCYGFRFRVSVDWVVSFEHVTDHVMSLPKHLDRMAPENLNMHHCDAFPEESHFLRAANDPQRLGWPHRFGLSLLLLSQLLFHALLCARSSHH